MVSKKMKQINQIVHKPVNFQPGNKVCVCVCVCVFERERERERERSKRFLNLGI